MNKTLQEGLDYVETLDRTLSDDARGSVFILPAFIHLWHLVPWLHRLNILVGAQNMDWHEAGAFTGEISASMLAGLDVDLVELGHPERRRLFGETDGTVQAKVCAALRHRLTPLVCVGEMQRESDPGVARAALSRQIQGALSGVELQGSDQLWIAYEPAWAIGRGATPASPNHAQAMHAHIRRTLRELHGEDHAHRTPIIYGGSVNLGQAPSLASQPDVDGLFIGRAARDARSLAAIVEAVRKACPT
jgi:triosephosphate isomerase